MKIMDISRIIHPEMEIYPGDINPEITRLSRIEAGDPYNISRITLGSHTGTHVDAPLHFLSGRTGIDELPLQRLVGPARVTDLSGLERPIEPFDLDNLQNRGILLLKGSEAHLTTKGAQFLADNDVKTVGTEALSIASNGMENNVHRILLEAGVAIIEGLDLSFVDEGDYFLVCLPLKIEGCDGAPARAILISGF